MSATLPAKGYFGHTSEYETRSWTALDIPAEIDYKTLFDPTFWKHHATKFRPGELIRMRRVDGAWDVQLTVVAQVQGGLRVEEWPKWPDEAAVAEAEVEKGRAIETTMVNGKPVPRVEHTPATKWRVIGLDGNEVSRNHATKVDAEAAMVTYAAQLGKVLAS